MLSETEHDRWQSNISLWAESEIGVLGFKKVCWFHSSAQTGQGRVNGKTTTNSQTLTAQFRSMIMNKCCQIIFCCWTGGQCIFARPKGLEEHYFVLIAQVEVAQVHESKLYPPLPLLLNVPKEHRLHMFVWDWTWLMTKQHPIPLITSRGPMLVRHGSCQEVVLHHPRGGGQVQGRSSGLKVNINIMIRQIREIWLWKSVHHSLRQHIAFLL